MTITPATTSKLDVDVPERFKSPSPRGILLPYSCHLGFSLTPRCDTASTPFIDTLKRENYGPTGPVEKLLSLNDEVVKSIKKYWGERHLYLPPYTSDEMFSTPVHISFMKFIALYERLK